MDEKELTKKILECNEITLKKDDAEAFRAVFKYLNKAEDYNARFEKAMKYSALREENEKREKSAEEMKKIDKSIYEAGIKYNQIFDEVEAKRKEAEEKVKEKKPVKEKNDEMIELLKEYEKLEKLSKLMAGIVEIKKMKPEEAKRIVVEELGKKYGILVPYEKDGKTFYDFAVKDEEEKASKKEIGEESIEKVVIESCKPLIEKNELTTSLKAKIEKDKKCVEAQRNKGKIDETKYNEIIGLLNDSLSKAESDYPGAQKIYFKAKVERSKIYMKNQTGKIDETKRGELINLLNKSELKIESDYLSAQKIYDDEFTPVVIKYENEQKKKREAKKTETRLERAIREMKGVATETDTLPPAGPAN